MRYFIELAYKGTNYHGWQRQSKVISVQEVLEDQLSKILAKSTYVVGCGRTDKGVHASQYYAHFDHPSYWDFDLVYRLNKTLPIDISIKRIVPVHALPNARFDALNKTYKYHLHQFKSPFLADESTYWEIEDIDFESMKTALQLLPGYQEYRAFCLTPDKHNTTICKVNKVAISRNDKDQIVIAITANRFIKAMIRKIVFCLQQIGEGKMTISYFESCLKTGNSSQLIRSAYPQGLILTNVEYAFL